MRLRPLRTRSFGTRYFRAVVALPLLFLLLFYFWPLGAIIGYSFGEAGEEGALQRLVSDPYYRRVLWFTTWQAVVSTGLTLLLALPAAWLFANRRFRGRETLRTLSTLPFVLPTIVVANAFSALTGPRGVLNSGLMALFNLDAPPIRLEQTIWLILIAHIFYNYSVALRLISGYWERLNPHLNEAAAMLGASPRRAFITITLPLLRPAIAAAAVLIFLFTFTSFGVILVLGGPRFATLEVEIYRQAVNLFNLPMAAALSLVQIGLTLLLMTFYTRSQARLARPGVLSADIPPPPLRTPRERLLAAAILSGMAALLIAPLAALVLQSVRGPAGLTLQFYRLLFSNPRGSLFYVPPVLAARNSVVIALITVGLAVGLGLISARLLQTGDGAGVRRVLVRRLDALFMLPLATSAVTLGFGFILAFGRPPLDLRASPVLIVIAHTLVALPFVIRAVLPALRAIPSSLREVSATLGADPRRVWQTVEWPLIRRAVLVGAVFAFTISMGEFGASLFVSRPDTPTLPVAIFRFLGQPGATNYGQALAMSSMLMAVCAVGFVAIERFRAGSEGEW